MVGKRFDILRFRTVLLILILGISACEGTIPGEDEAATPTPANQQEESADPPREELETLEAELNTTDVAVDVSGSPDQVGPGDKITYEVTVTNYGPNPASEVQIVDILPEAVAYVRADTECIEKSAREISCDLGEIFARESETIVIIVQVDADAVSRDNGDTIAIRNVVTVENLAGPDPEPGNNRAVDDTKFVSR